MNTNNILKHKYMRGRHSSYKFFNYNITTLGTVYYLVAFIKGAKLTFSLSTEEKLVSGFKE